MTAGELRAILALVPDETPVTHQHGLDLCHIDTVHRTGSLSKPGSLRVELRGRIHHEAPAPTVMRVGRWPSSPPEPVDLDKVRRELLRLA